MSEAVSREEAARSAREELSKPIYGEAEPTLLERLYTWFWEQLDELAGQVNQNVPGGWWVLGPLLAAIALLVLWLVVYTRPARRSRRAALIDSGSTLTAAAHRELAARHADLREYPEAIRERLRAITRDLEERAVIAPRPGRTATELAAETADALPGQRADLHRAATVFNDVWYGERTATAQDYELLCDLDEALGAARPTEHAEPTR